MRKFLAAAVGIGAVLAVSVPASATPTVFDFTGASPANGYLVNPTNFSSTDSTSSVSVQGWVFDPFLNPVAAANLHKNDNGLGVDWDGPGNTSVLGCLFGSPGACDGAQLDNNVGFEWITVSFASDNWVPISVDLNGFNQNEEGVSFFASNGALNDFDDASFVQLSATHTAGDVFTFSTSETFTTLYIGGALPNGLFEAIAGDDEFRVANVVGVLQQDVPEPASLALLGLGLAGLGAVRRRRKA